MFKEQAPQTILIFCKTFMQVINAVQIKLQFFKNATVDIIVSDDSKNAQKMVAGLEMTGLFRRTKYVETEYITYRQSDIEDIKDLFHFVLGKNPKYTSLLWKDNFSYDIMLFYNFDLLIYSAYNELKKRGETPVCMRFEEGISSYQPMLKPPEGSRMLLIEMIWKWSSGKSLKNIREAFCYFPEIFPNMNWEIHRIPPLNRKDKELIESLNIIFSYVPEQDQFPQKYIYFASSSDVDGFHVGETEMVIQIADKVGKNNLLIKMHPRDKRTIYEEMGLTVSRSSAVPWELIQLTHDFSDHVFISLVSSSIVTASAILHDDIESYFLFPAIKGKSRFYDEFIAESMQPLIENLQNTGLCKNLRCINGVNEIPGSEPVT